MPRKFGPTAAAGVSVTERDAQQPIQPSALGWCAYAGLLERGPTNELIWCFDKSDAIRKTGGYVSDSHLPDNVRDYFDLAAGAGGLLLVRVTDGNEVASTVPLYMRRALRTQLGTLSAKNGGRWGGREARATGEASGGLADFTETTLDTGVSTWTTDQWAGAYLELAGVANSRYEVISNDDSGVLTVASDAEMLTDLGAGATDFRWYLILEAADGKGLKFEIGDGALDPENEFSLSIYLDGELVRDYPDLSADDEADRYWVDVVNDDAANYYVTAADSWLGARPADVRPANLYGTHSSVTATVMTADLSDFTINSAGGGDPTFALGTTTAAHLAQTITITMTSATEGTAVSDLYGALGTVTLGSLFTPDVKWAPPFTVAAGGSPLAASDTLVIQYKPLGAVDSLKDGYLYPDKTDNPNSVYRIVSNTHSTVTVAVGSDMATDISGGSTEFQVVKALPLAGGRDGHADVSDNDYIQAYDTDNSLFRQLNNNQLGLVKFACPGVTSTAVQSAGAAFVSSGVVGAQQWRYEIPSSTTDEAAIDELVNRTLGRSAYGDYVVSAQSFGYVNDPEVDGRLKLISLTGMIHGRETSIAANIQGYHKAAAGLGATLPRLVKLETGERLLNEEFLNPRGINVIKKKNGNFVIWGNRTVTSNTAWRFKHARETMSYYIDVLRESFDFSVFEINDPQQWAVIRSSLLSFFQPEYAKRALDNTFPLSESLVIKIDTENNTALTQANGELNAEIVLRIVNSVENLRFGIGKAGVIDTGA